MSRTAPSPDPDDLGRQRAGDAQYYRVAMHKLIDVGMVLAEGLPRGAAAAPDAATTPGQAAAFDRLARAVRRTIVLARAVAEPGPAPDGGERRAPARSPAARTAPGAGTASRASRREPAERPDPPDTDSPDRDGDMTIESIAALLSGVAEDLGLDCLLAGDRAPAPAPAVPAAPPTLPASRASDRPAPSPPRPARLAVPIRPIPDAGVPPRAERCPVTVSGAWPRPSAPLSTARSPP